MTLRHLAPLLLTACAASPAADTGSSDASATAGDSTASDSSGEPTTGEPTTGELAPPGPCAAPIAPLARTTARLTVDTGGVLRDEHGRDVQLRGLNTGGRSKWAPFVPFQISADADLAEVEAAAAKYYGRLHAWGLDTVRMPFSWEALEPAEGSYDQAYLDRYVAMVDAAWAHGLRVIVDFHQDVYASPFCGDGFPPWTLTGEFGPPHHDCPDWGLGYIIDPGVREAFDRFWADADGVQAKYRAMWEVMAERVADHPGVLGLELINEPGWGTATNIPMWKQTVLNPFHTATIAHMRGVVGDEPLLLFDNTGVEAAALTKPTHVRPDGDNLMYAPHLYDGGLVAGEPYAGNEPEVHIADAAAFGREHDLPIFLGEFGYQLGAVGGEMWLTRLVEALDEQRASATLWEYSENESLWNEEDLSVVDVDGVERPILDVYVRPWLRAVAGSAPKFTWDPEVGTGTASWTSDGGVTEVVLPPRLFTADPSEITLTGPDGACYTVDRERGELRVRGPADAELSITFNRV